MHTHIHTRVRASLIRLTLACCSLGPVARGYHYQTCTPPQSVEEWLGKQTNTHTHNTPHEVDYRVQETRCKRGSLSLTCVIGPTGNLDGRLVTRNGNQTGKLGRQIWLRGFVRWSRLFHILVTVRLAYIKYGSTNNFDSGKIFCTLILLH